MDKPIIFADEMPRSTLAGMVNRNEARRLGPGIYTTDLTSTPERVVNRSWYIIAGHEFPTGVVSDRSGPTGGPVDGVLYVVHPGRARDLQLAGLRISARPGAGPQADDILLPSGIHLASKPRLLVENAIPSRARGGSVPRRLTRHELGEQIDQILRFDGDEKLNRYRDRARELAPVVGVRPDQVAVLDELIGTALGTGEAQDLPPVLHARRYLHPFDPDRVRLFGSLVDALCEAPPQLRPAHVDAGLSLPFFEAYFSNYIEGTEFTVDEAARIVFEHYAPEGRSEDAHDIAGTFSVVSDVAEMSRVAANAEEFLELLRSRHADVMAGRPDKRPGQFKALANQAGNTQFVHPSLVAGTLTEGFAKLVDLDTAWERSLYTMFLVSEVHPFDDGNGRVARIMMNSELVARNEQRIIIPTVFREDYLGALRRLSRQDDPSVLIKALRYAHDWTSRIDWRDFEAARAQVSATNAFEAPSDGLRLLLPPATMFGEPAAIETISEE